MNEEPHDHPNLDIPEFLRLTREERAAAWAAAPPKKKLSEPELRQHRGAVLREAQAATRKRKRTEALAKHLDAHKFERWNAKDKVWERDEAKINAHHAQLEQDALQSSDEHHSLVNVNPTGSNGDNETSI